MDNGRNPDIYTREFVEGARRSNQLMKGKMEAFGSFRDVLATEMARAMPELRDDVAAVSIFGDKGINPREEDVEMKDAEDEEEGEDEEDEGEGEDREAPERVLSRGKGAVDRNRIDVRADADDEDDVDPEADEDEYATEEE